MLGFALQQGDGERAGEIAGQCRLDDWDGGDGRGGEREGEGNTGTCVEGRERNGSKPLAKARDVQ